MQKKRKRQDRGLERKEEQVQEEEQKTGSRRGTPHGSMGKRDQGGRRREAKQGKKTAAALTDAPTKWV